ncbi:hypothetical protein GVAV_000304 [Gurleya vavrai]
MFKNNFIDAYKSSEYLDIINGAAGQEIISPVIRNLRKRLGFYKEEENLMGNTEHNTRIESTISNINIPIENMPQFSSEIKNDLGEKGEDNSIKESRVKFSFDNLKDFHAKKQKVAVDIENDIKKIKIPIQKPKNKAIPDRKIFKNHKKSKEIKDNIHKEYLEKKIAVKNKNLCFKLNSLESKIFFAILKKFLNKNEQIISLDVILKAKYMIDQYKKQKSIKYILIISNRFL